MNMHQLRAAVRLALGCELRVERVLDVLHRELDEVDELRRPDRGSFGGVVALVADVGGDG